MTPWPHGDPSAVVRAILATAPYRRAPKVSVEKPKQSLLELLGSWLHDHVWVPLRHLLHGLHLYNASAGSGNAGKILVIGFIGVAAAVLVYAIYRLVVAFSATPGAKEVTRGDRIALEPMLSSAQWRARANELARAGDYGRAIAALFTAALATLDERTIVTFDATRTPGEYRRLVRRARAAAAEPFNDLSGRFVHAAYAEVVSTADDFAAAERAFATFEPATA